MVAAIIALFYRRFKRAVKIRLKDQFIKNGIKLYHNAVYRIIKTSFCFESYLNELPDLLRKYFTKLRCRNHRLPIEAGVR